MRTVSRRRFDRRPVSTERSTSTHQIFLLSCVAPQCHPALPTTMASHRHVARNACPLISHACFVRGFAFCCRVLSRVSQVPILSASFWHYLHFLVQSARIFFACGGQKHSISFFSYTEGRAHLSQERPPVFDTRSVAHACRVQISLVIPTSAREDKHDGACAFSNPIIMYTDHVYTC